jgi:hypothetical protein
MSTGQAAAARKGVNNPVMTTIPVTINTGKARIITSLSGAKTDVVNIPRSLFERLTDALC